jgi:hypothetical protein
MASGRSSTIASLISRSGMRLWIGILSLAMTLPHPA